MSESAIETVRALVQLKPCCPKCTYELAFPINSKRDQVSTQSVVVRCEFCNINVVARFYEEQS